MAAKRIVKLRKRCQIVRHLLSTCRAPKRDAVDGRVHRSIPYLAFSAHRWRHHLLPLYEDESRTSTALIFTRYFELTAECRFTLRGNFGCPFRFCGLIYH
jgi:hypothetical protein